jgi:hypothetical protein
MRNIRAVQHQYQPVQWNRDGHSKGEPRRGERCSIAAEIDTPLGTILAYSVHLECFCGPIGRWFQFADILIDAYRNSDAILFQVIGGDLNTLRTGIGRLSTVFNQDVLRWQQLGVSEAQLWHDVLFSFGVDDGPINTILELMFQRQVLPYMNPIPFMHSAKGSRTLTSTSQWWFNPWASVTPRVKSPYAYKEELLNLFAALRNPEFYDPFPIDTPTLTAYGGVFAAKLDWLLLRRLIVNSSDVGIEGMKHSDHCYLMADVTIDVDGAFTQDMMKMKRENRFKNACDHESWFHARSLALLTVSVCAGMALFQLIKRS